MLSGSLIGPITKSNIDLIHAVWNAQAHTMADQPMPPDHEVQILRYTCNICGLAFDSIPNLRRHQTNIHGHTHYRNLMVHVISFAHGGLPHCSHCQVRFTSWRSFRNHLERNCCQVVHPSHPRSFGLLTTAPAAPDRQPAQMTDRMLAYLHQQKFGPALLSIIRRKAWSELRAMPDTLQNLTQNCIICGAYTGRIQDLNYHLRTAHPDFVPHTFAKMSQLVRAQASISPCAYCAKSFQRNHACPVLTQMAMLLVNLHSTRAPTGSFPEVVLHCEVCHEQFDSMAALTKHLTGIHRLEINDWVPARDQQGADPVCAHCHACFTNKPALRQHISRGQCTMFDPQRAPDELEIVPELRQVLLDGTVATLLQAPMLRLQLTLKCQLCGMRFERQGDLMLHLQSVHPTRWHQASAGTHMLMQACRPHVGCLCNPSPALTSTTHVCPAYRQLAMMEQKVDHDLFIAWTFSTDQLQQFFHAIDHAAVPIVIDCLLHRQFATLWRDITVRDLLRNRCLICGATFHPMVLCEHIKSMHAQACARIPVVLPFLLEKFGQVLQNDHQCEWCPSDSATASESPDRALLVQLHLQHHCPVLYQTGLLLTYGTAGFEWGSGHAVSPGVQSHGTTDDGLIHQVPRGRKRRKKAEEAPAGSGRRQSGDQNAEVDGIHDAASGCGAATTPKTRLMDLLHANRAQRTFAELDLTGAEVACRDEGHAEASRQPGELCATETVSVPTHGPALTSPPHTARSDSGQGERSAMADHLATWSDSSRGHVSLPQMATTTAGSGEHQADGHPTTTNADLRHPTRGTDPRSACSDEVPCPHENRGPGHSPVAAANLTPPRRTTDLVTDVTRVHSVGSVGDILETSHVAAEQARDATAGADGQGKGKATQQGPRREGQAQMTAACRSLLCCSLATSRLDNDSSLCFVNATFLATMWAFLCVEGFQLPNWGPMAQTIITDCLALANQTTMLSDVSWMAHILSTWGNVDEQGDAAEFLQHLIRGLNFAGFTFRWERRIQLGLLTTVRDENDSFSPIILYVDPALAHENRILLRDMIQAWHDHLGMVTALVDPTDLICIHINRLVQSGDGRICKSNLSVGFHWGCSLPFFTDDGLSIQWKDFQVVSAIAHQGQDGSGHYRSWLKVHHDTHAGVPETLALLTGDSREAERIWHTPPWFDSCTTCLWLCSCDQLHLHQLPRTICNPVSVEEPRCSGRTVTVPKEMLAMFSE